VRAALTCLLLAAAAGACIGNEDITGALDGYCASSVVHACGADSDCCSGFACAGGSCVKISPGECLPIDAGTQASGAACGCSADCSSHTCSGSKCQ
jgi:hypothetical protein